jgi:hypothetical protein
MPHAEQTRAALSVAPLGSRWKRWFALRCPVVKPSLAEESSDAHRDRRQSAQKILPIFRKQVSDEHDGINVDQDLAVERWEAVELLLSSDRNHLLARRASWTGQGLSGRAQGRGKLECQDAGTGNFRRHSEDGCER